MKNLQTTVTLERQMSRRLQIIDTPLAIEEHRAAMEDCLSRTGGDIYFAPDWLLAWLETCGRHGQLRLFLIWDGERLVGFLPFLVETLCVGPVPVRIARLAGTDPSHAVRGLPLSLSHDPSEASAYLELILPELRDRHAICLSPLSKDMEGLDIIRATARRHQFDITTEDWHRKYTVMHLPEQFETWLDALPKSRRREYRKDLAALGKLGKLTTERTNSQTATARLDAFAVLHGDQWKSSGKAGHFDDWPDAMAFSRAVIARLAASDRAWIDEHWCGEVLLSAQYGFRQGGRVYWWLIGRTMDQDFVRLGVGRVGLVERVRDLISQGVREIEAGAGEYDYKLNYGGELVPMGRIVLATPGAKGRVWLLLRYADLLDLLYYRIWFLKMAPHLRKITGFRPRPLWQVWRRTRI